jgi:hypothetical protein
MEMLGQRAKHNSPDKTTTIAKGSGCINYKTEVQLLINKHTGDKVQTCR